MDVLQYVAFLSTGLALIFASLCLLLWRRVKHTEQVVQELRSQHQQLAETAKIVGRKLVQLQSDLQGVAQKLQTEQAAPSNSNHKAYGQAARLLQQGMSPEEVMQKCSLSRGEAELLAVMTRAASGD